VCHHSALPIASVDVGSSDPGCSWLEWHLLKNSVPRATLPIPTSPSKASRTHAGHSFSETGEAQGCSLEVDGPSAAAEISWEALKQFCSCWLHSIKKDFWTSLGQEGLDLPQRSTSIHNLTVLSRMIIYLRCLYRPNSNIIISSLAL
jgi:hypothetical protein